MDDEVCPAPRGRPSHSSPDPEMAKGGSVGGRPMVGDQGRYSAGSGGLTAACERLLALRLRPVGRSLAQESGSGRCHCRPVCRRSCATNTKGRKGLAVVRNCFTDEGRSLGTGLQEQVPNHLRRLWSKGMVVSTGGKGLGRTRSGGWQEEDCKGTTDDVSKA